MKINDYEKVLLGTMMKFANSDTPKRVAAELSPKRFESKVHQLIAQTIKNLIQEQITPNTVNVSIALKDKGKLDVCGGIEYLESLVSFPEQTGTFDDNGIGEWVELVDKAGRLRSLGSVLDKYQKY